MNIKKHAHYKSLLACSFVGIRRLSCAAMRPVEIMLFPAIRLKKHARDKSLLLLACSFVGISQLSCVAMRLSKPQPQQL